MAAKKGTKKKVETVTKFKYREKVLKARDAAMGLVAAGGGGILSGYVADMAAGFADEAKPAEERERFGAMVAAGALAVAGVMLRKQSMVLDAAKGGVGALATKVVGQWLPGVEPVTALPVPSVAASQRLREAAMLAQSSGPNYSPVRGLTRHTPQLSAAPVRGLTRQTPSLAPAPVGALFTDWPGDDPWADPSLLAGTQLG